MELTPDEFYRLWAKFVVDDEGCWEWTGPPDAERGYGYFFRAKSQGGQRIDAHRLVYELLVGPVPDGLELDHLCRNRMCVRPSHLEPVTHRVNVLRGESPAAHAARREVCAEGHPLVPRRKQRARRYCPICLSAYRRARAS